MIETYQKQLTIVQETLKRKDIQSALKVCENLNQALVKDIDTSSNITSKPIWFQLGLHFLELQHYEDAIKCLYVVVRLDKNDARSWEALADAYFARGSLTSAMKSYKKAAELANESGIDSIYSSLQAANIKLMIGQLDEAIVGFEEILRDNAEYVPALKGLSEAKLAFGRTRKRENLIGCCRDFLQESVDSVTLAIKHRGNFACLWKTLADALLMTAELPDEYSYLVVNRELAMNQETKATTVNLDKEELFKLAIRCYCRAISITSKEDVQLWYSLAIAYYSFSKHTTTLEDMSSSLKHAYITIKHCLKQSHQVWQYWNLLGLICCDLKKRTLTAHYAFRRALKLDKNNAILWTNLGVLYQTVVGDLKLANGAYAQGQRNDPMYPNSWIGQSTLADLLGRNDEAMDLYRHSCALVPFEPIAGLGYGQCVLTYLLNNGIKSENQYVIKNMHAIEIAADAMEWYTVRITDDPLAWNVLGLLKERQRLHQSAARAFFNALKYVDMNNRDRVLCNYARVLCKLGKLPEAIEQYHSMREPDIVSVCGLALAYFKAEDYQKSCETYETAFDCLSDDGKKSHVLVSMAIMAYMFDDFDNAKTLLFQSIQLKPPSIRGLFAACAFGIVKADFKLANLVLKELRSVADDEDYICDVATLTLCNNLAQNSIEDGLHSISEAIHKHPTESKLWTLMVNVLLLMNVSPLFAVQMACTYVTINDTAEDMAKLYSTISRAFKTNGDCESAKEYAQTALFLYPNEQHLDLLRAVTN